ncbi:MAG: 1,4-beta-glucanase [Oscillospiraceae bacterium]|nr:1,4-beta-glucanase [Oscillospiraceae bacterium]
MKANKLRHSLALLSALALLGTSVPYSVLHVTAATADLSNAMTWGTLRIGGGGFVSGIVTGKQVMYARTDVGGAYKYDYDKEEWVQLLGFINDADRGLLSVDAMAIDPTDDNTVYFLCGCAYFSNEKTVVFKTTDGGRTFRAFDISDEIKVMGNGDGRQCGESIAVDPDNPKIIYAGGDVACGKSALIKSTDGGETWKPVESYDALGLFGKTTKWPTWTENIARSVTDDAYNNQNGVAAIAVSGGKVYVATSAKGVVNVHAANVSDDKFSALSADLPTDVFPSRINLDANGDLLISYIAGLAFNGTSGGAYRYSPKTGKVTQLLESTRGFGSVWADPANPDHLIAGTCGKWEDQLWEAWTDEHGACWGDQYYRSLDGGKTWENITPGKQNGWGGPLVAEYLQDGGFSWIREKAIHWSGTVVTDPRNPDRMFITSGNGVFICENLWSTDSEKIPKFTFHPNGIEEVVALDFASTPDGLNLSAIGDYDGFRHTAVDVVGEQYQPNMGSTSAIAVCPQNTDVWVRIAEGDTNNTAAAYYTLDRGKTWKGMTPAAKGGKAAIAQIGSGKYRIFNTSKDSGDVSYSDDFGGTWNKCAGIPSQYGSKPTMLLIEPDDPNTVYAYATYFNSSWHYSKDAPTAEDAQYKFCVSTDGGKTFTSTDICMYDQCDSAGRIAYLGKGELILGGGWYGLYHASVRSGKVTVEKIDGVSYCKTVGYGAPEKTGGVNTLYMYGKPLESDPEGIYRSTDAGKSWVCINTEHLYGGTGNGNFLVGDMSQFGKVYMSTVGCGIVYGEVTNSSAAPGTTPAKTTTAQAKTTTAAPASDIIWGDANSDTKVDVSDCVLISRFAVEDTGAVITDSGKKAADVTHDGFVRAEDATMILRYIAKQITAADLAGK